MAFGNSNRSFGKDAVLYSFKIKTKDLPEPVFEVSKKIGEDYQKLDETAKVVSGNLISASPRENDYQGKIIRSINLTLQDGNDVYFLSVGETFIGRNLYNALLALKTFDDIQIGLYQSKKKPGQDKTFASVSLRQHGETVRGLYDNKKELPAVKKVRVNGKDQSDTEELDNFFREKMKAFCKVVNAATPKAANAPTSSAASEASHETDGNGGHDDGGPADGDHEPTGDIPF